MRQGLITPLEVKYKGLDADEKLIDGVYFGRSIEGTSKLYNQTLYLFENGVLPAPRSKYRTKIYTGVPREGSVFLCFYSLVSTGQMAVYPQLWGEIADLVIPEIVKATWSRLLNRPDKMMQIIEVMQEESQKNREFAGEMAKMAIGAVCQDKSRLLDIVEKLAEDNKYSAKQIVEPVGRSCAELSHVINEKPILQIDEPEADVISSKEQLEVTDMKEYKCQIEAVDKINGSCRVIVPGLEKPISGKITDPSLQNAGNVYTHALDQDLEIVITAKTTEKNGEIQRFFISDARQG